MRQKRTCTGANLKRAAIHRYVRNDFRSLKLQGVFHRLTVLRENHPVRGVRFAQPEAIALCPEHIRLWRSPPSRGRGSKPCLGSLSQLTPRSPPSRGRGSKLLIKRKTVFRQRVAPLAGAWIETPKSPPWPRLRPCRPPRGGVDRNTEEELSDFKYRNSRPPRGGVDRNALHMPGHRRR